MFVWGKYESVCFLEWVWSTALLISKKIWKFVIICVQNQWGFKHPWHGTVANLWGRHKDFTKFNENFEKSYLLNGLSNIVKFFTVWFLKIFCIKWIHIFFWVQCSFKMNHEDLFQIHHRNLSQQLSKQEIGFNRPYAYDVTEGRPRALGVKRGTATCTIAKHAASGPTPACHTAEPAGPRTDWEAESTNALCQHNTCAHARQVLTPSMASLSWSRDVNA